MNKLKIIIDPVLKEINPGMAVGILESTVTNSIHSTELWEEIMEISAQVKDSFTLDTIKNQPRIAATRKMYSACGKDPSRYRPSAEALMRRIVKGQDLYQINTLVDIINLTSLKSGYSINGFDAALINGSIVAGLGKPEDIFNAIGRGLLNIDNLPVYRDTYGPIGSPTSDEERTAIRPETNHILLIINAYEGSGNLPGFLDYTIELLGKYAMATTLNREIIAV